MMKKTPRQIKFMELIKTHGYDNVTQFCNQNDLIQTNMSKRLRGDQGIEILFLFKLANILHEPVDKLVEVFYPQEYQENQDLL